MARLDLRTFIRATPERVWEIISDLSGHHRWMVDLRELRIIGETKSGAGTVIEVTSELYGLPVVHDVLEIVTWDPPNELGIVHKGEFTGTAAFWLVPLNDGTVFRWCEEFQPPLGPLGELGFRFIVGPHLRQVFARSMDNARRLAEAKPD